MINLGQLGSAALYLAGVLAIYSILSGIIGSIARNAKLLTSSKYAAIAVFLAMTTAIIVMEVALLSDDMSVKYVARHSRIANPLWVKAVTLWAALEGSVLLWGWILTMYTAILALTARNNVLKPWVLVVMQAVQLFFISMAVLAANPFVSLLKAPLDGPGPNPLLQNHWMMAVHPVLLYLGYVGITVPFAFAMAALITKQPGTEWMTQSRRWTMVGWMFLSAGIIAGGWWSYEVLGWGGYWAWDPVENVSFMPWLAATAFIHSIQVQERRRMLKSWNLALIIMAFSLSILGTFLVRSGIISSVHAFGDGPVGPYLLVFFLALTITSVSLAILRWDQLKDNASLDSVISKESSFLVLNVLLLAMLFTILLGTIFPLIVEAITNNKVTVGPPFFNTISVPLWLLIFLVMGIGPLLPWRKAKEQTVIKNLSYMLIAALIAMVIAFMAGIHKIYPLLTIGLAAYNLVSLVLLISGAIMPRAKISNRSASSVFKQYAFENKRRFGSMIVHFGVIIVALGIAGSSAYRIDQQIRVDYGSSVNFQGYNIKAVKQFMERSDAKISAGSIIEVSKNGKLLKILKPSINTYGGNPQTVPSPAIMYTPFHDLFLSVVGEFKAGQSYTALRAVISPFIMWIWIGAFIILLGTAYALSPNKNLHKKNEVN